jgi:hypothetical protein
MSHFSGGVSYSRGGPLTDAEVTIPYYTPWVDFAVGGSVSAWPMLQKSGCPLGLVQVGQGEIFHAYTHNFVEVEQCYYDPLTYNGPVEYVSPIGQTHHYRVQHHGVSTVAAYIDVTLALANTGVNWVPDQVYVASETHAVRDQNYGAVLNKQQFSEFTQCDSTRCYSNAAFCLFAGNLPDPCSGPTARWLALDPNGSPGWKTYDTDCQT